MSLKRTTYGIGYKGFGEHPMYINNVRTKEYSVWYGMMARCYSKKIKPNHPTYKDACVDECWHNFQAFAEWYKSDKHKDDGYQLDKDLLVKGNKVYSPEFCCLLPSPLNKAIITSNESKTLTGANFNNARVKWQSQISKKGKSVILGFFDNEIDAHIRYVEEKEAYVRSSAEEWKGRIDDRAYEALKNWTYY